MDIKLDFMPPSLINFISRQLIGNGHKLYQKVRFLLLPHAHDPVDQTAVYSFKITLV